MAIALDQFGIDLILLHSAVQELVYIKQDVGASLINIFVGKPVVDNIRSFILRSSIATPQLR